MARKTVAEVEADVVDLKAEIEKLKKDKEQKKTKDDFKARTLQWCSNVIFLFGLAILVIAAIVTLTRWAIGHPSDKVHEREVVYVSRQQPQGWGEIAREYGGRRVVVRGAFVPPPPDPPPKQPMILRWERGLQIEKYPAQEEWRPDYWCYGVPQNR